ncbi:ABC transporter ATP-binding protein/permease [bacterium]|nr:ABC transporter ATP-binding protein/permease [bacterium]
MSVPENKALIHRYLKQPTELPTGLRRLVEAEWDGEPVQLYALTDLDDSMRLARRWLVLGPSRVALVEERPDGTPGTINSVRRDAVREIRETPGLSATTLAFLAGKEDAPLLTIRFTHRQRRAVENIRYILDQQIEGYAVESPADADALYADSVSQAVNDAQAAFAANKLAVVWRLVSYLGPYRGRLIAGMIAAALMTLTSLLPPLVTGRLIDKILSPYEAGTLAFHDAWPMLWPLVVMLAVAYLVMELFAWVRLRTMSVLGELVAQDLRDELYGHLQTLSMSYFSRKQTGSIISRVSSDTDRLWDFIAFGVVEVSLSVIKLTALGAVLLWLDVPLGLVMILPVPVLLWSIFRHGQTMQRFFLRAWRKWSDLTDVLSDTIPGMRVVKAFNQEDRETRRFNHRNQVVVSEFNSIHQVWTVFWPKLLLCVHALVLTVWMLSLPRLMGFGGAPLTVGTFVSFLLYTTMFFQPIEVIGQMARMLNRATSSAHRIFEVLDTEPQITDVDGAVKLEPVEGQVTFDNVSFAYDGVRQTIKGITFDVKPGEMIGLVGPSGAGKTTITNLIARFYEATGGEIRIDGVNLKQLDTGHYRQQVGMVLQDPYLFHGSIVENIRYARPDARPEEVIEAAKAANAHDFICKLAHGYDTIVGERGQTLSGGERQRVSIARAILANPRILILDEATSSVDTETESKIQEALDRLVAGRTVFAIAHRLSTLAAADRLFVIEDGRLVEEGTHGELLEKEDGVYRKLHRLQQELHEAYAV